MRPLLNFPPDKITKPDVPSTYNKVKLPDKMNLKNVTLVFFSKEETLILSNGSPILKTISENNLPQNWIYVIHLFKYNDYGCHTIFFE